ncbi:MAG: cyclase family protein [Candidatus Omnitrophica bacterium]|nr:cyclase family protein [Candidatus Omnitrophota bacterium]
MKYRYLSYPVSQGMPVYGGKADLGIKAKRAISSGDNANVYKFSMESHWGTHIDAPRHFFDNGKCIEDYPCSEWVFTAPQVINTPLGPAEILRIGKWMKAINPLCDILIFRSGWSALRRHKKYVEQNPGIHPEVAVYLKKNCRNLRAIGIDWLSISSIKNRELGREAHRAFLDSKGQDRALLLVEDMRINLKLPVLRRVIISPIVVSGIDSAPCMVIGEFND